MQLYKYFYLLCIMTLLCNASTISHKIQKNECCSSLNEKKHTIIFDLTNVLFKENHNEFAKKIGYGTLASYALTHWKSPGYRCLDMLAAISKEQCQAPHVILTLKGRTLPKCLVELQEGIKSCADVKSEITQCIECLNKTKFFSSDKEKNLMLAIMHLILDPCSLASMMEPIKPTVQLVQKLKSMGHRIILFANAPEELFAPIKAAHPDIIKLFDTVIISSHIKKVKPERCTFDHLLSTHNLTPQDCIIIDDLEATIKTAQALKMNGIVYDKISHVISKLRKFGVKI